MWGARPWPPGPPPARERPQAPTCVAGIFAVAKALEGALGPGLGAHACGRSDISVTPGGRQDPEPPKWEPREGCTASHVPAAGRGLGHWERGGRDKVSANRVLPKS